MKRMHSIATWAGAGFLLVLVQLLGALAGSWISALCGLLVGGLTFPLLAFFRLEALRWWVASLFSAGSSLAGVMMVALTREAFPIKFWLGPILAGVAASAVSGIQQRQA